MNKLTYWIKGHQITAFFIITFTITWGLGFSYGAAQIKGVLWLYPVASLATCGPALAGIIITALTNTQPREGTKRTYWIAFFVAWGVSALVWLAHHAFINHAPLSPVIVGFALVLVVPVAFVISMAYSRIPTSERLPGIFVPVARCVGLVSPCFGVLPGSDPAFDPRQQPPRQAANHKLPTPGDWLIADRLDCSQILLPVLFLQCHRGRSRLAWICHAQVAEAYQPLDRQPDPGLLLGTMALFLMAVSGTGGHDLEFLD